MENITKELKGLGGWLILPALGLIVTPFRISISLYKDFLPVFQEGYWELLTTPLSEAYHHLWAPYLIFEIVGNLIFIIFSLLLIFLFFTKSYRLPKLIIIFYISNLIFLVSDLFLADMIPAVAAQENGPEVLKEVARSIFATLIWVPYFLVSKRVKNTFVKSESNKAIKKDV